jgi:hypothetical protein
MLHRNKFMGVCHVFNESKKREGNDKIFFYIGEAVVIFHGVNGVIVEVLGIIIVGVLLSFLSIECYNFFSANLLKFLKFWMLSIVCECRSC